VFVVVVPNAVVKTPVELLYARGYEAESDDEEILLLKSDQSVVERRPRFAADAVGRLKVSVLPLPVTVKSVPEVLEANVIVGPVCNCPVGPIEVTAAVTRPRDEVAVSVYPPDPFPTRMFPYEGAVVRPVPP
jgi:hypothetical protein